MFRASLLLVILTSAAFAQQPHIDQVSPAEGPIGGGTIVTIRGANFTAASITLDRHAITPLSQSDSEVRLQMPAHDNGYAILSITRDGHSAFGRFLYVPPRLADLPAGYITTVAGVGAYSGEYGPAKEASIRSPWGMTFDASGVLYFVDTPTNRVLRIRSDGILEPFAGNSLTDIPPVTPAPALDVPIAFPRAIVFDSHGNLIVPDGDYYLWRIDAAGQADIIAGTGAEAHSVSEGVVAKGTAIGYPSYVAIDAQDNIYFIDWTNARVRKIDPSGRLTTVIGNGTYGFSGDGGAATSALFDLPFNDLGGLAVDHQGNILLLDWANHRIRRVAKTTGIIDTIVGPALNGHTLDNLLGLAVGPDDAIYFSNAAEMYRRATDGSITKIASGKRGFSDDGSALPDAAIGLARGLVVDPQGNLLYADTDAARIRRVDRTTNVLTTLAGTGPRFFGEDGRAIAGAFLSPNLDLGFLPSGDLLVTDNNRIWSIGSDSRMRRFAGGIGALFDVPALSATMSPASLFVAKDATIDFAEGSLGVFRIDGSGIVRHTAGKIANCGFSGDGGNALDALFCQVWDARRDASGNLFIADTNNNRIRRVDANGTITTFAGSGTVNGLERYGFGTTCGDGGAATNACINTPYGMVFDDAGNLFVCENENDIRRIDRNGTITTFANVRCTKLGWAFGNLFTVASDHVARVSRSGEITSLTTPILGFSGDGGPASAARVFALKQSHGVAVDRDGNLFFIDGDNLRVRAIRYGAVMASPGSTIQTTLNGSTIRAVVTDVHGHPAEGVRVDFHAPSSGPSCALSSSFGITDPSGVVSVSCTPNCLPGAYTVAATPLAATSTATVPFVNSGGPCRRRSVRH